MTYVDTSVALAHLLSETRKPAKEFWSQDLVSSRLLAYESWTRLHALGLGAAHADALHDVLAHLMLLELNPQVLARAVDPFPAPVRTLDALHLASLEFLRAGGRDVTLATYDARMATAAQALGITTSAP